MPDPKQPPGDPEPEDDDHGGALAKALSEIEEEMGPTEPGTEAEDDTRL